MREIEEGEVCLGFFEGDRRFLLGVSTIVGRAGGDRGLAKVLQGGERKGVQRGKVWGLDGG